MSRVRSLALVVLTIAGAALLGGIYGRGAAANEDRLEEQYRTFTSALGVIESRYVDKVESDRLVYGAISGMLQTLDPHSSFMDPRAYAQLRERQEGRYYGLGITIQVVDGDITVQSLFEGSPAYKKGIRRGDVIAEIESENAKGWTSDQAVRKLRGPKGTTVKLALRRVGYDQLIPLEVPRDEISIPSIPAFFMVDAQTGYVRLQDFAENTDRDLSRALQTLGEQGMKRLAARPAGQPGRAARSGHQGLQSVPAARRPDRLHARPHRQLRRRLPRAGGERLHAPAHCGTRQPQQRERLGNRVRRAPGSRSRAHRGRDDVRQGARAVGVPRQRRGRARAHDRALLHAERTADPAAVGRDVRRVHDVHAARPEDRSHARSEGSEVHGGGPQGVRAAAASSPIAGSRGRSRASIPGRFGRSIYARQLFGSYAQRFSAEGDTRIQGPSKDRRTVGPNFEVDDAMLADFKKHVAASGLAVDEQAFAAELGFIKAMIRYEIDLSLFGVATARRHLIAADPQAQSASRHVRRSRAPDGARAVEGHPRRRPVAPVSTPPGWAERVRPGGTSARADPRTPRPRALGIGVAVWSCH